VHVDHDGTVTDPLMGMSAATRVRERGSADRPPPLRLKTTNHSPGAWRRSLSRDAPHVTIECGGIVRTVPVRCNRAARRIEPADPAIEEAIVFDARNLVRIRRGIPRAGQPGVRTTIERVTAWTPSLGAFQRDGGTVFSVWAPHARRVDVILERGTAVETCLLKPATNGMFSGWFPEVAPDTRYWFKLDADLTLPDPASRWQPDGPHGPSALVDPNAFEWTDGDWRGVARNDLVIYELHVGTFTTEGTFAGVESRLPYLASLGVTAIELMPVAEWAGARNWGYDGVDLFAPSHHYGTPADLRRLVDAAHRAGLAVLIDVVYNHFGPDGAALPAYSPFYLSTREQGPWGPVVNLDGEHSEHVRAFLIENALHWIHEYHVDGLRLDATHTLVDHGHPHFLAEVCAEVRAAASRAVILIAEDERNFATLLHPPARGYGFDAVWADDWHHQMRVALAGDREGYFADFEGAATDIAETIRQGWFYCGQCTVTAGKPRGSDPSGLEASQFVICLENHDQIGNRPFGERLHHTIEPAAWRAASVALLMLPQVPLLFMGQEWAASTPFLYFTDHRSDLGAAITEGRRAEFSGFTAFADPANREAIPDPQAAQTFALSRLIWDERRGPVHASVERLYRSLLQLRRREAVLRDPRARIDVAAVDDATLTVHRGAWLLVLRLRGAGSMPAPAGEYDLLLTSEDADFCVNGSRPAIDTARACIDFSGPAALVLRRRT
jgi:maltooligosyltrehalose trehalohydrolase